MRRIRMIVEYDGTGYSGWQRQLNAVSVQEKLEEALRKLTREKELFVVGASRTDAGVHAFSQNVHFDTGCRIPAEKFAFALNAILPEDIRIRKSFRVKDDFHARFDAVRKEYRYVFFNSQHASAIMRNHCAHVMYPLDEILMDREAKSMIGTHDFAPFAASGSVVKDTVRTIYSARVVRTGDMLELYVEGNGFLYNMVRILAGTLIYVGCGKLELGTIQRALESKSRLDLGVTAPARGLTLMRIDYNNGSAVEDEV